MTIYQSVEEVQAAATKNGMIQFALEVNHRDFGRCFIGAMVGAHQLRAALKAKPMAEIIEVVAEHPGRKPIAVDDRCKCDRCNRVVDPASAYKQTEHTRIGGSVIPVTAHYCSTCAAILKATGAMAERASEVPSYEPTHKEDC